VLGLYRRVFEPSIGGLAFIGLLQPLGAIMPVAEAQSAWVCDHLAGRYALPPEHEMRAEIERERRRNEKRYVASKRHTMQVDYDDYMADLERERKAGAARAAAAGNRLPVPPRAVAAQAV
jgi:dimethylaniline monooxygenase (N-oxide forming)